MENILFNGYSRYTTSNHIQRSALEERDLGDGRTSSISASCLTQLLGVPHNAVHDHNIVILIIKIIG